MADLRATINELWEHRSELPAGDPTGLAAAREAIDTLDRGENRVAEVDPDGSVVVHEWLK
ncbi:MAG: 2,3,4,5-tetrahydropyridine-2,6-dicarboxylate N-succinyltransferase, partial [Acidimicrobiaceae bacterium]|nr:2,3,4,5-tetrahydropyridine-2,6-dicarboxylate N-succinyltransferase [Acidimicrobiaceae bacterium]